MFRIKFFAFAGVLCCLIGSVWVHAANVSLSFTISRPATPRLYFKYLTLKVNACGATSATVTVDGQSAASTLTNGNVVFTTAGNSAVVNLVGTTTTTGQGTFSKAVLKDDKKWAWSHGLDDNYDQSMNAQINAFKAHNYTGTCFWNGIALPWYPADMTTAVAAKWTIGNHTWSHEGADGAALTDNNEVTQSDQAIITALASAGVPNFLVNTFANPYFNGKWTTIVKNLYTAGSANIVLIETGQSPCKFICDAGATAIGGYSPISSTDLPAVIGRDFVAYGNVNATTDYMHTNSNETHHLWYNSGNDAPTDGSGSGASSAVAHVFNSYNTEAWVASSAEVYDYLLTSRLSTVTYSAAVFRSYFPANKLALSRNSGNIFDFHGRIVGKFQNGLKHTTLAGTGNAAGAYLVRSLSNNVSVPEKIIVQY
jgi:hypothetical protein